MSLKKGEQVSNYDLLVTICREPANCTTTATTRKKGPRRRGDIVVVTAAAAPWTQIRFQFTLGGDWRTACFVGLYLNGLNLARHTYLLAWPTLVCPSRGIIALLFSRFFPIAVDTPTVIPSLPHAHTHARACTQTHTHTPRLLDCCFRYETGR